jgi:hypothetical protein
MATNASDKCRVSQCDRLAAASVHRDDFPARLQLCATHTEEFRQGSVDWRVDWDHEAPEPTSVLTAEPALVGRGSPIRETSPAGIADPEPVGQNLPLTSLWQLPAWTAHKIQARVAARRKGHA